MHVTLFRRARGVGAFALMSCLFALAANAQEPPARPAATPPLSIESKVLGENRAYRVYLPGFYEQAVAAGARFPVVYVLDGQSGFPFYWELVSDMAERSAVIPPVIVVAVDTAANRIRDLTPIHSTLGHQGKEVPEQARHYMAASGGADKFLGFLATELMPHIDAKYRTAPHRVLVGHSLGGLTAAHSFLSQPGLFQGYVSIDGSLWWADRWLITRTEQMTGKTPDNQRPHGRFYLAVADMETTGFQEGAAHLLANAQFAELLQKAATPRIDVKLQKFDDENHMSVVTPALYHGLRYIYDGYVFKTHSSAIIDPENIQSHFRKFSERMGYQYLPPERLVESIAQTLSLAYSQHEVALAYLRLNVANYPNSSRAHSGLAGLLRQMGDAAGARESYQRAMKLDPKNEEARAGLVSLGGR